MPATSPVPVSKGRTPVTDPVTEVTSHVKVLATEFPVVALFTYPCGSKLNTSSEHTVSFAGPETGVGLTVIINDSVPPVHV